MNYRILRTTIAWITALELAGSAAFAAVSFTKVDAGDIGTDPAHYHGIAWGDYDGDGHVDLFAGFYTWRTASEPSRLYHNNGDGTFTKVLDGGIADDTSTQTNYTMSAAWADFENDGDLDLFVAQHNLGQGSGLPPDWLYLNNGDGTFMRAGQDWIVTGTSYDTAWGDFDNNGLLDLFVTETADGTSVLYNHQPDHSMLAEVFYVTQGNTFGCMWSDYDNDRDPDLFIAALSVLWDNDGGVFTPVFPTEDSDVWAMATADYDNDGDLDLAIACRDPQNHKLYQNNGDGSWTEVAGQPLVPDPLLSSFPGTVLWGDYDNDGWIDLLIPTYSHPGSREEKNLLFHNNGDGTFTRITEGPLVTEYGSSQGGGWADYDNDGDLDLALADGNTQGPNAQLPAAPVALYRNDGGNDNNWINLTLVGSVTNRSAIGAKVYAHATINGVELQQMREVQAGSGIRSQNDMRVHFGLGDATVIDELRIEWPSGLTQTLTDVASNQFMEITESYGPWVPGPDGYCDTTPWMGWFWVVNDPWVYSVSLEKWIYCPSDRIGDSGGWVFVPGN